MEAFSLLKFWRSSASTAGGVAVSGVGTNGVSPIDTKMRSDDANLRTTTTTTTIKEMSVETDEEEENGGDGDDGPFFDLEFTIPTDECGEEENEEEEEESDSCEDEDDGDGDGELEGENESTGTEEEEREFDFTVSSGSTGPNLSPSDDLFFKGEFVPIDHSAETQSKLQFPGAFLKPATKLRVFMLGFKKAKSEKPDNNGDVGATLTTTSPAAKPQPQPQQQPQQSKSFTVKFKVEEVPIMSLFTRDNSSKTKKQHSSEEVAAEEKRFAKAVVNKYLKMVKPLYVRVSKRYGEKLGFSGQLSLGSGAKSVEERPPSQPSNNIKAKTMDSTPPIVKKIESGDEMKELSQSKEKEIPPHVSVKGNLTAGFRVVCKHLVKSRSASSAVAAAPPLPPVVGVQSKRQDDSLLQQQDGIQSAILHCKRSFNGSRDSDSLSRLSSSQSREKSKPPHDSSRTSFDERKVES